mmetsp:Transcript_36725/g.91440  ORF Transcript_36725/g.91440 Transcript_36725/m.91440 type:complete len:83 (+) Transcript_36725:280-528(+)
MTGSAMCTALRALPKGPFASVTSLAIKARDTKWIKRMHLGSKRKLRVGELRLRAGSLARGRGQAHVNVAQHQRETPRGIHNL